MKLATVRISALNKERLAGVVETIVSMDRQCMDEMGEIFCTVPWNRDNYMMDLKGKWELSRIAEDVNGKVIRGIWIASNTVDDICHTHRVIVRSEDRGRGIAEEMFNSLLAVAREKNLNEMTIEVSCLNEPAIGFYEGMHYLPMDDTEIRLYLEKRGRRALVRNGRLEEGDGSQYFVLKRGIR